MGQPVIEQVWAYAQAIWPPFIAVVAAGLFLGIDEAAKSWCPWLAGRLDMIGPKTRHWIGVAVLLGASLYAGFTAWRDEHTQLLVEHTQLLAIKNAPNPNDHIYISMPVVYSEFPSIGTPKTDPVVAKYAYLEVHENAIVMWIQPINFIVRLNIGAEKTFQIFDDNNTSSDNALAEDSGVQAMLGLDKSCLPPLGGIAVLWKKSPSEWKSIGCRKWRCGLTPGSVRYQVFSNGYVISGIPRFLNTTIGRNFYMLSNSNIKTKSAGPLADGVWREKTSENQVPECVGLL